RRSHHDAPGKGKVAIGRARAPSARRILETDGFGATADGCCVLGNKRLDVPPRLALEEIRNASSEMTAVSVNDKQGSVIAGLNSCRAACGRFMHDEMRYAPYRHFDARSKLRPLRDF